MGRRGIGESNRSNWRPPHRSVLSLSQSINLIGPIRYTKSTFTYATTTDAAQQHFNPRSRLIRSQFTRAFVTYLWVGLIIIGSTFQWQMQQHHWCACLTGLQHYNMLDDGRSLRLSEERSPTLSTSFACVPWLAHLDLNHSSLSGVGLHWHRRFLSSPFGTLISPTWPCKTGSDKVFIVGS